MNLTLRLMIFFSEKNENILKNNILNLNFEVNKTIINISFWPHYILSEYRVPTNMLRPWPHSRQTSWIGASNSNMLECWRIYRVKTETSVAIIFCGMFWKCEIALYIFGLHRNCSIRELPELH